MMAKKIELLTLEQVRNGVDQLLKDEVWTSVKAESNPNEFRKRFNQVFGKYLKQIPYIIQLLNSKDRPFKFYRIRRVNDKFNADLISTHAAPTSDVCNHYQRANIPNYPVFYGSQNPGTAIAEILQQHKPDPNDDYILSEWTFRENTALRICPFIFSETETDWMREYSFNTIRSIKESFLKHYSDKQNDGFIEALRFLSELFLYEDSRSLTGHIAHFNLYANHSERAEIFIYPSVQTVHKTVNFAIHPNCIHQKAILKNLYRIKLKDINRAKGTFHISFIWAGENKDGVFHWHKIDEKGKSEHTGLQEIINQTKAIP